MRYFIFFFSSIIGVLTNYNCSKSEPIQGSDVSFTTETRLIADQIISVFENATPVIQYDYIENIHDGRGYTAGRAGFTTATCDLLEVVNRYTAKFPSNNLVSFIPRLQVLCNTNDSSVTGLSALPQAWATASKDAVFKQIQDDVVNDFYFNPALKYAQKIGAKYQLTLLNIYDACIQHGDGTDADGLAAMLERTRVAVGGNPANGVDEVKWLDAFMTVRKNTLLNPANKESAEAWKESVYRVDALRKVYDEQNFTMKSPFKLIVWGTTFVLPQ